MTPHLAQSLLQFQSGSINLRMHECDQLAVLESSFIIMKISMRTVPKDIRTWSLYSITRGPYATSAWHMTSGLSSGGTTSSFPKCLYRPGATAAGAWPRHALGSVLLLDLIFIASCL